MTEIFGVPVAAMYGQLLLGLINGSFYALLSLGLAIIFGLLKITNFAHGAQYMLGAFAAWMLLNYAGIGYWWALLLAPLLVGIISVVLERVLIARIYSLDPVYGLLLTFGIALVLQGLFRHYYGSSGLQYGVPPQLTGATDLGFMMLPNYRAWVVATSILACVATWVLIEKTKLGVYVRAATENATLTKCFGIPVPGLITLTYGFGGALAAFAGVLAAPVYAVNPLMGADLVVVVFAVVVIGGMGSIAGSVFTGYALGLIESLTRLYYPQASVTVIFVIMGLVLLVRPMGLFGKTA